ncbi:TetR family transcriptional regulator [Roseiarcus fermentans]|uniref:TetR family transcriptional regulator n=1 Tax=Roseiarcus fermentans TaxID=1473586 RepID=A0A366EJY3_9HYPH|nr:TetR/AcrR family transcriptional regulator [Roseiarcus fermentans]RBP02703.1 TetR family transcriptional regulator [Roseiarcus fermentans]
MPPKPPRRTRERILETALAMFNELGEPTVATTSIAIEMGISPGNLYYHYRSKEAIVQDLFAQFRREIEATLAAPESRLPNAEDCWLFLHLVFEAIWKYRFIYRDINDLVARYRVIEVQFRRILAHKIRVAQQILGGLVKGGQMRAEPSEIATLAENIVLVASYWMSFENARDPRAVQDGHTFARGAFHVIALAAPYLEPRERELFDQLAKRYIA